MGLSAEQNKTFGRIGGSASSDRVVSVIGENVAEAGSTCGTGLERSARESRVPLSGHPRRLGPSMRGPGTS